MDSRLLRRSMAVVLTLFLLMPATVGSQAGGRGDRVTGPEGSGEITTADDFARRKLDPELAAEIDEAPADREIMFIGRAATGTDLSAYTDRWFARHDPGVGIVGIIGFATPAAIVKIASEPGVMHLQLPKTIVDIPQPPDEDLSEELNANIDPAINQQPGPGPAPEGWYSTGPAIHASTAAWDKGFTGQGVIYMSNDSGADYCHADLHGTWAYINGGFSPYQGLPMMFDSISMLMLATDVELNTNFFASGQTDYADTRATTSGATFSFAPIGAAGAHTFSTTGTSLSGVYHYGSHPDNTLAFSADVLSAEFGDGSAVQGQRAAVLVVDENQPGVYDTVYVDLNYNYDFSDDEPARLTRDFSYQETACLDYNEDGLNDVSGGLVYYVSDGSNPIPAMAGLYGPNAAPIFGPGELVAFHVMDSVASPAGNHGMGTTSVATGQGVVRGNIYAGPDGPPQAEGAGLVVGPGRDVKSTQNGDFYSSPFFEDATLFATLGPDGIPFSGDEVQIISNSWGTSDVDNDGWDPISRLIDLYNRLLGPNMTQLFSTGNGAAGYGTSAPPSPSSGIMVGASTLYDTVGQFEPIASADQIVGGDPMSWSNRGPGAMPGKTGVDVVATGAFGTGDLPLNEVFDGAISTADFGGTSMAAPVAAGNLALIYDAWFQRTGEWPTFDQARQLLMGGARNTDHDVWTQGAGIVDADRGTDIAAGLGGSLVSPSEWEVGDYRGQEYAAFGKIIAPGESDTQTFTFTNFSGQRDVVNVRPVQLTQIGADDYSFRTGSPRHDHGEFTTPDYVFRIDENIPPGTDMLMVRVSFPYEQFDPDGDMDEPFNTWRVHLQNWTDLDGDGVFWTDANGNGKVDVGEMDANEHIRFTYGYNAGPTIQARIGDPLGRMDDGILLTFRHRDIVDSVPWTDLQVEVSYWQWTPWAWVDVGSRRGGQPFAQLQVPGGGSAQLNATLTVPNGTPYGMYEGALMIEGGVNAQLIPINVAVAAERTDFEFGGQPRASTAYDNSHVFGYTDYRWRAESGDWRFYWADFDQNDIQPPRSVRGMPPGGQPYLVVDNQWSSPGTDIDTLIFGPAPEAVTIVLPEFGPYTLDKVGGSPNRYQGSGRWGYDTSSGGPREIVAGPISEGLHGIFLHQVRVDGDVLDEQFRARVGKLTVAPDSLSVSGRSGSATISVTSELAFDGLVAQGYGPAAPEVTTETVQQDDPNDPSTASFMREVELQNAAALTVGTCCTASGSDIDLYIYGPDGSLVASSTTPTDAEFVSLRFPADGTYTIAVHGWSVPTGEDTFELSVEAVQGTDLTATAQSGALAPNTVKTITVSWNLGNRPAGVYQGVVLFGPPQAPGLIEVPIEITITGGGR